MSVVRVLHTFHVPGLGKGGGWAAIVGLLVLVTMWPTWSNCLSGESSDETTIQIELRRNRRVVESPGRMTGADIAQDVHPAVIVPVTPQNEVNRPSEPLTISTEIAPGSVNQNGNETESSESG